MARRLPRRERVDWVQKHTMLPRHLLASGYVAIQHTTKFARLHARDPSQRQVPVVDVEAVLGGEGLREGGGLVLIVRQGPRQHDPCHPPRQPHQYRSHCNPDGRRAGAGVDDDVGVGAQGGSRVQVGHQPQETHQRLHIRRPLRHHRHLGMRWKRCFNACHVAVEHGGAVTVLGARHIRDLSEHAGQQMEAHGHGWALPPNQQMGAHACFRCGRCKGRSVAALQTSACDDVRHSIPYQARKACVKLAQF
mmetsp:Transcript_15216/g.45911  ORF Transcript_15216/g.45911 Transcript_15216/m.45911 type:complete len:249 (-) Transcript_15216:503-1249(-)